MTIEAVADGMAVPDSTHATGPSRGRDTRGRVMIAVTLRGDKASAPVLRGAVDVARVVAADFTDAWFWHDTPPALATLAATDVRATVPDRHPVLTVIAVVWKWLVAAPVSAVAYPVVWALQRPITGIPFVIVAVAMIAMFRT